ncbi:hypothetical protein CWC38_01910 [Kocuria tytonicola]|uniref:hypothetical protein n=1 Tax=Kocuria tytonicola TaxID=2055946 RepID=UPI000EF911CF|nr:hypothetical protein [Kocuria tytonicola]RLZ04160.1 hypothetical protein CWC38_01910 [Kocuria tytonicola]
MADKTPKVVAHDHTTSAHASCVHKNIAAYLGGAHTTGTRSVLGGPILDAARRLVDDGPGERDSAVFPQWVADQDQHPRI